MQQDAADRLPVVAGVAPQEEKPVHIERRFNGPPDSANGGYVAGLIAQHLSGAVEVTLLRPPPLETRLRLRPDAAGGLSLVHGAAVVATARTVRSPVRVPAATPTVAGATAAGLASPLRGPAEHPYSECFVCGSGRTEPDGLGILPGPLPNGSQVADVWTPTGTVADADGHVRPEFLWCALDCPGGHACVRRTGIHQLMLGRITAEILAPVIAGSPVVCVGWFEDRNGRRLFAGSALLASDRRPLAIATATWIAL